MGGLGLADVENEDSKVAMRFITWRIGVSALRKEISPHFARGYLDKLHTEARDGVDEV